MRIFDKHVVLISGYPGCGKSSFAKLFEQLGYFLIDDPRDLNELGRLVEKRNKIVITDPYLTIKRNMEFAKKMFVGRGYVVSCLLLIEDKNVCLSRAAKRKGKKKNVEGLIKMLDGLNLNK